MSSCPSESVSCSISDRLESCSVSSRCSPPYENSSYRTALGIHLLRLLAFAQWKTITAAAR